MGMQHWTVRLASTAPMLCHNIRLSNPMGEYARKLKKLNKDLKKRNLPETEELRLRTEMAKTEFLGGLYFGTGPALAGRAVIPGHNVKACIRDAAKNYKKGATVGRGLHVHPHELPVKYKGPQTRDGLLEQWEDFSDQRMVTIKTNKVLRTRPMFPEWGVEFMVSFDDKVLDPGEIEDFLESAGVTGLGDARTLGFGSFDVAEIEKHDSMLSAKARIQQLHGNKRHKKAA